MALAESPLRRLLTSEAIGPLDQSEDERLLHRGCCGGAQLPCESDTGIQRSLLRLAEMGDRGRIASERRQVTDLRDNLLDWSHAVEFQCLEHNRQRDPCIQ